MELEFKDHFSENSGRYGEFRPTYPVELFSHLSSITKSHDRAWDCATGTGQSALYLAHYYSEVIATDASKPQIDHAVTHNRIDYRVAPAENSNIQSNSIDLITVAQALHWFDIELFSKEVFRVLKRDGILAVWTYNLMSISEKLDEIIDDLYGSILGDYWPPERALVEEGYKNVELPPFTEIASPVFHMSAEWDIDQVAGYLSTWSAVREYRRRTGVNPVEEIYGDLLNEWGDPEAVNPVKWPLNVRLWKN